MTSYPHPASSSPITSPLRQPAAPRPFHISRASDEITQFPSYEAMAQLSNSPNNRSRSHSHSHPNPLFASLTASVLHSHHHNTPYNNLSTSTLDSPEPSASTHRVSHALGFFASFLPRSPHAAQLSGNSEGEPTIDSTLNALELDQQTLDPYPSLTRLLPLTLTLLSSNLVWTLLIYYAIHFLIKLNLSTISIIAIWLASPISGLLVPPLVALLSDSSQAGALYRRRSWIAGSTLLLLASLVCLSFCQPLGAMITYILGDDQGDWDPNGALHVHSNSIRLGIFSLYVSFFALDSLSLSARSLILDQISAFHQNLVNVWASRLGHLGNLIGFVIASLSDARHGPKEPQLLRDLVAYTVLILISTSALTCLTQAEEPALKDPLWPRPMSLPNVFRFFTRFIKELPVPIRRVCYVQIFSSVAWISILYHAKPLVARFTLVEMTSQGVALTDQLLRYAERQGSKAMLILTIVALVASVVLPLACELGTTEYVIHRRGHVWNAWRKMLSFVTPRNLWTASFVVYLILICVTFGLKTGAGASALVGMLGVSWAVAQWVPYALLMEYARSIEETPSIQPVPTPPCPATPLGRRASVYVSSTPPLHKSEPRVNERTVLLAHTSPAAQTGFSAELPPNRALNSTRTGGCTLAVHELTKVIPHFFVSIVSSMMFNDNLDAMPKAVEQPTELLWFIRLVGSFGALGALVMSRKVVIPTSELEYWDELEYQIYESERVERGSLLEDAD